MPVRCLVVKRQTLLHGARQRLGIERRSALPHSGKDFLQHVEKIAPVAIRHADHRLACLRRCWKRAALEHLGAANQGVQRLRIKPVQHQHLGPGEKRTVQLEGWVFGRGANEDDRAILDIGQERVLLRFVEAVDLINEEKCATPLLAPDTGLFEDLLEIGNP